MKDEDIKVKHKADVYYFNVDIKFIIKARLFILKKRFEENVITYRQHGHAYMCYNCDFGKERRYKDVDANSIGYKCEHCKGDLKEIEDANKLADEDEDRCRTLIEELRRRLEHFDNYIVPANFFGPGHLSAYVGSLTTQHVEDTANVNLIVEPSSEFLGLVRKQKLPRKFSPHELEEMQKTMRSEIQYFYN
jgi:hypothetical protein